MARVEGVVAVALGCLLAAAPCAARILVIGDSNAVGHGVKPSRAWTNRLERSVGEFVQVYGAPGAAIGAPLLGVGFGTECLFQDVGLFNVRVAVLALGTNDGMSTLADVRLATRQTLQAIDTTWICITPPSVRDETAQLAAVRAVIAEECTAAGAALIDGAQLITLDDLADDLHLNKRGHAKLARAVKALLP